MPGYAVNGNRVIHRRLRAGHQDNRACGRDWLTIVINDDEVSKASHARGHAWVHGCRGSGVPMAVVDEGRIGEASCARRWGHAWRGRSQ
jgi:hypothetical protein